MKILNKFSLVILLLAVLLTACNKENIDTTIPEDPNYQPTNVVVNNLVTGLVANTVTGLDLGCLTVIYPFDLSLEDSTTITINSEADFQAAITMTAPNLVVDFVYPLNIIDNDGNAVQAADANELGVAFASCIPTTGWTTSVNNDQIIPAFLLNDFCFDLVYPTDLEDTDGNTYVANDQSEFIDLLATVNELFFSLPLTVVDQDGNQVVITDTNSFFDLSYQCNNVTPAVCGNGIVIQGFGCSELVYPVDAATTDGTIITVNNADEYSNLILSGEILELQFPFSLVDSTGTNTVINNVDDLVNALTACGINVTTLPTDCNIAPAHFLLFFNQGISACGHDVNYPLQIVADNVTYDVNDLGDYFDVYNLYVNNVDGISLIYPVTITMIDTGEVITFNNDDDVCTFISGC